MRIYEIWQAARKDRSIQLNEVFKVLLELGLTTFSQLPESMQQKLFKKRSLHQNIRLRECLRHNTVAIASRFKLDDRLAFALPGAAKRLVREEAEQADLSMSEVARRRIIMEVSE